MDFDVVGLVIRERLETVKELVNLVDCQKV